MHRQVGQVLPHQYLLLLPQMVQLSSMQGHQIFTIVIETETYLGAKITPESVAFIHKAHRSLLLFGSLFFCSAHIRERWCGMLTMSTATSTSHCLNISSNFSGHFRTGRLWLGLLCYSQTPWQPCSQAAQTAALLTQLLKDILETCRGQTIGQYTGKGGEV